MENVQMMLYKYNRNIVPCINIIQIKVVEGSQSDPATSSSPKLNFLNGIMFT